jgi:hypothetical protein
VNHPTAAFVSIKQGLPLLPRQPLIWFFGAHC